MDKMLALSCHLVVIQFLQPIFGSPGKEGKKSEPTPLLALPPPPTPSIHFDEDLFREQFFQLGHFS